VHYKIVPIKVADKLAIQIICDKKWHVCFILLVVETSYLTCKIKFIHTIFYHILLFSFKLVVVQRVVCVAGPVAVDFYLFVGMSQLFTRTLSHSTCWQWHDPAVGSDTVRQHLRSVCLHCTDTCSALDVSWLQSVTVRWPWSPTFRPLEVYVRCSHRWSVLLPTLAVQRCWRRPACLRVLMSPHTMAAAVHRYCSVLHVVVISVVVIELILQFNCCFYT